MSYKGHLAEGPVTATVVKHWLYDWLGLGIRAI